MPALSGMSGIGGCGCPCRMADQSGSPRPSRGISPWVPMAPLRTYNIDGAQPETPAKPQTATANINFERAFMSAACYTAS